jgi:hypothetical protein
MHQFISDSSGGAEETTVKYYASEPKPKPSLRHKYIALQNNVHTGGTFKPNTCKKFGLPPSCECTGKGLHLPRFSMNARGHHSKV